MLHGMPHCVANPFPGPACWVTVGGYQRLEIIITAGLNPLIDNSDTFEQQCDHGHSKGEHVSQKASTLGPCLITSVTQSVKANVPTHRGLTALLEKNM